MNSAALRTLIVADARLLWRDPLLVWMTAVPIGMAFFLRFIINAIDQLFPAVAPLVPAFHPLIMGGYLMTAPGMIGFVIGFLLIDERDSGTIRALRVTPLSMRHYLAYRLAGPLLIGMVSTIVGYPLTRLAPLPVSTLIVIAGVAGLTAPMLAFALAALAPNKVAGLAVVKVLNAINLLPIAAYFLPLPLQYVAGVLPTYWPMRALWSAVAGEPYLHFLAAGLTWGLAAVVALAVLFERRLAR